MTGFAGAGPTQLRDMEAVVDFTFGDYRIAPGGGGSVDAESECRSRSLCPGRNTPTRTLDAVLTGSR
jgi:hypothetical protein